MAKIKVLATLWEHSDLGDRKQNYNSFRGNSSSLKTNLLKPELKFFSLIIENKALSSENRK